MRMPFPAGSPLHKIYPTGFWNPNPPSRYLQPGPNQKLNGPDALWFARGRCKVPTADLARQARQRCTVKAIVERATPQNVLTNYNAIAKAGEQLIRTDIPKNMLAPLVTLGQRVKTAKITNIDLDTRRTSRTAATRTTPVCARSWHRSSPRSGVRRRRRANSPPRRRPPRPSRAPRPRPPPNPRPPHPSPTPGT